MDGVRHQRRWVRYQNTRLITCFLSLRRRKCLDGCRDNELSNDSWKGGKVCTTATCPVNELCSGMHYQFWLYMRLGSRRGRHVDSLRQEESPMTLAWAHTLLVSRNVWINSQWQSTTDLLDFSRLTPTQSTNRESPQPRLRQSMIFTSRSNQRAVSTRGESMQHPYNEAEVNDLTTHPVHIPGYLTCYSQIE